MKEKNNKGFTIIEVLIVLVIVIILSYISFSYIQKELKKSKIVSDIRAMYGLIQEGRKKAFSEKIKIKFNLDVANKRVCIINADTNAVIRCKDLNSDEYASTQNPLDIDKRGTFQQGQIYYTGELKGLSYSCIKISDLRVKMGVWNGSDCEVK